MKIKRDRRSRGQAHRFSGGFGVMWHRGQALWHVYIRLLWRLPIEITWARKVEPLPELEDLSW